ncbi:MAG: hypothetical protein OXC46_08045, partial [Thaumarchaeota archaeon]|nr:hypothetical protein [Nitrososphaerota archaeon]
EQLTDYLENRKLTFKTVGICNYSMSITGLTYVSKDLITMIEQAYGMEFDHINGSKSKFDIVFNHDI